MLQDQKKSIVMKKQGQIFSQFNFCLILFLLIYIYFIIISIFIKRKHYRRIINMQFYGEKPLSNYNRPVRRQSKNYTTVRIRQPWNEHSSKSIHKPENNIPTYKMHEKENPLQNCKSTVNIQFAMSKSKAKHEKQRSNSFLNKSQVQNNRLKTQNGNQQTTQKKRSVKSRWELTQYNNEYKKNQDHRIQENNNQKYDKYLKNLKSYQKFNSMNVPQPSYSNSKLNGVSADSYSNQYNLKKYWGEPDFKIPQYKNQTEVKRSNSPFYERVRDLNSTAPTFRVEDSNFMSQTVSFQGNDNYKLSFMNQSLGGNKYKQLCDNFDFKSDQYSPRLKNCGSGNLAKPTLSRTESLKQPKLNDFIVGQCKGQGRFGKVYMAVHRKTGFLCALKKIKKQSVKYMIDQFIQQVKIQLYLNHPKLVKVYGYFADKQYFYMLVQYMEQGSLYSLMKKNKKLDESQTAQKLYQICEGIKEMHDQNIVHRDLKPQNVVMTNGVCKICDFGWAAICENRRQTYCGTLDYVCPEIVQGNTYDSSADIWCIGVLAYELMCGKAPFYDISRQKTIQKIKSCKIDSFPSHLSQKAVKFIEMILKKNPDCRVGISELLNSDFLKSIRK